MMVRSIFMVLFPFTVFSLLKIRVVAASQPDLFRRIFLKRRGVRFELAGHARHPRVQSVANGHFVISVEIWIKEPRCKADVLDRAGRIADIRTSARAACQVASSCQAENQPARDPAIFLPIISETGNDSDKLIA